MPMPFSRNQSQKMANAPSLRGPLSHNLQVIDYNIFLRDAALTQGDFSSPCGWPRTPRPHCQRAWPFTQVGCWSVRVDRRPLTLIWQMVWMRSVE
jgi:hypothetical protein